MITASRYEAADKIREWADEAENGNYHDLSGVLNALAEQVEAHQAKGDLPYIIWTVKSVDEPIPDDNIAHIAVL